MAYPTQADVLAASRLPQWLDDHFLRADPFAFPQGDFRNIVRSVSANFDVDVNGVFCIGSGAIGLSLNPKKIKDGRLKPFGSDSDLDLALISEVHFETAWRDLRRATQPLMDETHISRVLRENLDWQRKKFFDGAIVAHKLLPELSFGSVWQAGLLRVESLVEQAVGRPIEVNLWIYRDYWSLRNYVSKGFVDCMKRVQAS